MNASIMRANSKCHGTFKSERLATAQTSTLLTIGHRYFSQRYSIFSWYDEGVYMTDDAWFGVTPEPVAKYVLLLATISPSSRYTC
jgi:hypothetical protein